MQGKRVHLLPFQMAPLRCPRLQALGTQQLLQRTGTVAWALLGVTRSEMGTLNSLLHLLFSGTNGSEVQPCDWGRGNKAGDGPSLPGVGASKMLLQIVPDHSWLSGPPRLLPPPTQLTGARQRGRSASGAAVPKAPPSHPKPPVRACWACF